VIAQQRGRQRSLVVGVGQAMQTATIGVDMAVGIAIFPFFQINANIFYYYFLIALFFCILYI
jgi:hypothetical protein